MLRRLPLIIGLTVALDWVLLGLLCCCFDKRYALAGTGLTTLLGLVVIFYYEWRWSETVAKTLESEPGLLDAASLNRILLFVAGIILLIPGLLTDVLGLVLVIPPVRRAIVNRCNLRL